MTVVKDIHKTKNSIALLFRYAVIIGVIWTIIIAGSFIWNIINERKQTYELAKNAANVHFKKDQAFRLWGAKHGGVYVPVTESTRPNKYLAHIPERNIKLLSGKELTLMNPAYMVREMIEDFEDLYGIPGRITSLKVLNPINEPDEWEKKALQLFESGITELIEFSELKGSLHLRLMRPMITKTECLKCHKFQGYKVGDIRGGVGLSIPMAPYNLMENNARKNMIVFHLGIWFLGIVGICFTTYKGKYRLLELKLVKKREKDQYELMMNVMQSITHPFYVIDANDYSITVANSAAKMFSDNFENMTCHSATHNYSKPCNQVKESHICTLEEVKKTGKALTIEHTHYDINGNPRFFEIHGYPVFNEEGNVVKLIEYTLDITDRKAAEEKMKASLLEKEVLLREIHHRVKNNMQVISSLLRLQSRYSEDKKIKIMFQESQNRIESMAMIHEKLYQSNNLVQIDMREYIKDLTTNIFQSYEVNTSRITLNLDIEAVAIGIDTAIPCGLIVNELVSNSLKHAFPDNKQGEVNVIISKYDNKYKFIISDNGIGISEDVDFEKNKSLGLILVKTLSEKQLKGNIELYRDKGSKFLVTFNEMQQQKRM